MGLKFTLEEIIKLALKIEESGYIFYQKYSEIAKSEEVKKVFDLLASEEKKHYEEYQNLLSRIPKHKMAEKLYLGNDEFYLKVLARESIFSDNKSTETYMNSIKNDREALELALNYEFDTIEFFNTLKKSVPLKEKSFVNTIILKERQHYKIIKQMLINMG
ncbi:MAG: ferritin family protein [Actinomycetota bacterium]